MSAISPTSSKSTRGSFYLLPPSYVCPTPGSAAALQFAGAVRSNVLGGPSEPKVLSDRICPMALRRFKLRTLSLKNQEE